MTQKAYAEGMRALILYTATIQDEVLLAKANGKSEDEIKDLEHLNDLLLPIVKGYGSERAWTLLGTESLQTFGGSGFTQDWPLEQYVRDAKIDTLYEGTTAIQGLDFFFRKIIKDNGRALTKLSKEIGKVAASGGNNSEEKASLGKALEEMQPFSKRKLSVFLLIAMISIRVIFLLVLKVKNLTEINLHLTPF